MSETSHRLGAIVADLRRRQGRHQIELARQLGLRQQTVSRWEAGSSRPRPNQISALAAALEVDPKVLLDAAGYNDVRVSTPFDQPFPVDTLSPNSFERFALYFLERKFRQEGAEVHRAGGQGHDQDGIDIVVRFPDQTSAAFQCKRVREFGPQKVHSAVAEYKGDAARKVILLARVASPQARAAAQEHAGWDIWDREDISLQVRALPVTEQRELVDIFFPGSRLPLLGENAPGPWQTFDQFFAPFATEGTAFNHLWTLVGRAHETKQLISAIEDDTARLVALVGPGGVGKSRVLNEALSVCDTKGALLRFLSPTEPITAQSLEELGRGAKLLVVDDAHDRTDLDLLFQYASNGENKAKLVLAFRPYGRDFIIVQAARFALTLTKDQEVPLGPLTIDDAEQLAREALLQFEGPADAAQHIAKLTFDCPLATVIGAQVVAANDRHLELLKNESLFRTTLMARFDDVITGNIGERNERPATKRLLAVLALLQPFSPEDGALLNVIAEVERMEPYQVSRLMRLLADGGVIFKRGGLYRIAPDLLGDYIIEKECVALGGSSTGYAERVFDAAAAQHLERPIENLIVNLGKVDWRRADRQESNGRLLDGVWAKLNPQHKYGDPHMKAVISAAFYQPERALTFASRLVRRGRFAEDVAKLLKNVAYSLKFLPRACAHLWELGKADERETNPHPYHPIRVLKELAEVDFDKPLEYSAKVIDFGLSLLEREDSWSRAHTPLDFMIAALETDGRSVTSNQLTVTFTNFAVPLRAIAPIRQRVVRAVLDLLESDNDRAAFAAAGALNTALRYPTHGDREPWVADFSNILNSVRTVLQKADLAPMVRLQVARSISWHAHYGDGEPAKIASGILSELPTSLEFKLVVGLADGYRMLLEHFDDFRVEQERLSQMQSALIASLNAEYPSPRKLREVLENALKHIKLHDRSSASPQVLLSLLLKENSQLAQEILVAALGVEETEIGAHAGLALGSLLRCDRFRSRRFIDQFMDSGSPDLGVAVGQAYWIAGTAHELDDVDIRHLRALLASNDSRVVLSGVNGVQALAGTKPSIVVELLRNANLGLSAHVADRALMLFAFDHGALYGVMRSGDVAQLLEKLKLLPELKGHWIETFLAQTSEHFAHLATEFFISRVEHATMTEDWKFRPCNHGPYGHVKLKFRSAPDFPDVLRRVSNWMASQPAAPYFFHHRAAELFGAMFAPFDASFVDILRQWTEVAKESDLRLISRILREAPPPNRTTSDFVFRERQFVFQLLERAQRFGDECHKVVWSNLYGLTVSGVRSGTPGEPFPEDIQMRDQATSILEGLAPSSPAHDLYDAVLRYAEESIRGSIKERELWEE